MAGFVLACKSSPVPRDLLTFLLLLQFFVISFISFCAPFVTALGGVIPPSSGETPRGKLARELGCEVVIYVDIHTNAEFMPLLIHRLHRPNFLHVGSHPWVSSLANGSTCHIPAPVNKEIRSRGLPRLFTLVLHVG